MNITKFIDGQFRRPTGIAGHIIGGRMARQHVPENMWTVSLLDIQLTDSILELGFGPGIAIQRVAALATEGFVAGIDFSHAMVSVARKRNAQAVKAGRVELKYGDVVELPFDDNSFDKAFSIHSIYFWSEPITALKEVLRVLKPGGMLAMTILPKAKWPNWEEAKLCHVYSGDDMAKLMTDVGFTRVYVEMGPEHKQFRELSVIGMK